MGTVPKNRARPMVRFPKMISSRLLLAGSGVLVLFGAASACVGTDPDLVGADSGADAGNGIDVGAATDTSTDTGNACGAVLATDPRNCGRCGHDCLPGGSCEDGACKPIELVKEQGGGLVRGFTISGAQLYWVADVAGQYSIKACNVASCTTTTTSLHSLGNVEVRGITADATYFYFAVFGGPVYRCPLAGCGGNPEQIVPNPSFAATVAVDDTTVFWSAWGGGAGRLGACPKAGCASQRKLVGDPEPEFPCSMGPTSRAGASGVYRTTKEANSVPPEVMIGSDTQTTYLPVGIAVASPAVFYFTDRRISGRSQERSRLRRRD